jgi:hypothetical protein
MVAYALIAIGAEQSLNGLLPLSITSMNARQTTKHQT